MRKLLAIMALALGVGVLGTEAASAATTHSTHSTHVAGHTSGVHTVRPSTPDWWW